jgi:hypothetical protein
LLYNDILQKIDIVRMIILLISKNIITTSVIAVTLSNTSGKAGAQMPISPWEMIHLPGGDNAACV